SIEDVTNYIPKTTSVVYKEGSIIRSISVAVNIASRTDKPWGATKLKEFESLISSAVGLVKDNAMGRIDVVKVVENEFEEVVKTEEVQKVVIEDVMDKVDMYLDKPFVKNIMGALLLIILLLFYKKIFAAEKIESQDVTVTDAGTGQIFTEESAEQSELLREAEVARIEAQKASEEMAMLKEATEHEPQSIAAVIESWVMKEADS
ncbi:MAG: hypothetical protein HRT88_21095, partial [Lentisphaeraceae bacterium]|nr:hypothetical protein [Lentisphaeraceae bacterium]